MRVRDLPEDAPWEARVADGARPDLRRKLVTSQLVLLRQEAGDAADRLAAVAFSGRRAKNVEVHLSRAELAALLRTAYEVGYCSGVGEPVLARDPDRTAPREWHADDLCRVRGEGDQVFRIGTFDARSAVLYALDDRLHGRERVVKLTPVLETLEQRAQRLGCLHLHGVPRAACGEPVVLGATRCRAHGGP